MSVDDWARREAKEFNDAADKDFSRGVESAFGVDEDSFSMGAVHAFDAILSDEVLKEVRAEIHYRLRTDHGHTTRHEAQACKTCLRRADVLAPIAIQAAIDAVTKEARDD